MSSWESHLPESLRDCQVTGLGLNREELESNTHNYHLLLSMISIRSHCSPLTTNTFDAVICTVSIEYLVRPREVMAEVARVLRPGGIFVVITIGSMVSRQTDSSMGGFTSL